MSHIPKAIQINIHNYNQCSNVQEHQVQCTAGLPAARCHTSCLLCVLSLAQPWGPDTHHCLASLVCRRSAGDPTLTRHHDPTPKLIGRHCCGFDVSRNNTHTPSWGWIFNGHIKSPEKQNTKINITVRSQTTTISQLQYPLQYNLYSRYKISIIHPSRIHP